MIVEYSIAVFATQLIFIGCRTWNIKAIAAHNIREVLISGAIVHLSWLVSITIDAVSMYKVMSDFSWEYVPVVLCSLAGGLLGSYIALIRKRS